MYNKTHSTKPYTLPYQILVWLLLIVFALIINQRTIRDGLIFESNDIKYHILWLQQFSHQISEGILYPRWLSGDNYGYGSPTFVFYPPLVYYVGTAIKLTGLDIQTTITVLFFLATFLAGLSFYHFGRDRYGKLASLVGSLFYMSTPYVAFNIYSRGALAEVWAMIWIPIGLWVVDKALNSDKLRWRILLATVAAAIALTHVPSLLIFTISCLIYLLFLAIHRSWKKVFVVTINIFLGFGLVSFYLLPAILEKSLVNIDFMRFDDGYKKNLLSFGLVEANKALSKNIEPIFIYQIAVVFLLVILTFFYSRQNFARQKNISWLIYIGIVAFLCIYPSLPIWQLSGTLQMIQFPWRLFGILSFGVANLFSLTVKYLSKNQSLVKQLVLIATIAIIIASNLVYSYKISLKLPGFNNPGDIAAAKARGSWKASIYEQIKVAIENPNDNLLRGTNEYRPLLKDGTPSPKPQKAQPQVTVIQGDAATKIEKWNSYHRVVEVKATLDSTIKFRTYFYPAWHLYVNNKPKSIDIAKDGTIVATIPSGIHSLELRYQQTNIFKIGLLFSLISLISLFIFNIFLNKNNYRFKKE